MQCQKVNSRFLNLQSSECTCSNFLHSHCRRCRTQFDTPSTQRQQSTKDQNPSQERSLEKFWPSCSHVHSLNIQGNKAEECRSPHLTNKNNKNNTTHGRDQGVPPHCSPTPGWCPAANSGVDSQRSCSPPRETHRCRHNMTHVTFDNSPSVRATVSNIYAAYKNTKASFRRHECVQGALTTAVSCVWGSAVAVRQGSHSSGCELYSARDNAMHIITCWLQKCTGPDDKLLR